MGTWVPGWPVGRSTPSGCWWRLSGIAHAYDANLAVRAADVTLKERRRLVLMLREAPLSATHLELALQATRNGAVVFPPVPAFYTRPASVDDIVDQTVGRALDLFDLGEGIVQRWDGRSADGQPVSGRSDACGSVVPGWASEPGLERA
jgi:hypothetical protein